MHSEFEKAQAEIGRLKTQLSAASSTNKEDERVPFNEPFISGSGLEIETPDSINSDASREEEQ